MDYKTLFAAYQELLQENSRLTTENTNLKTQFGVGKPAVVDRSETPEGEMVSAINNASESKEKIQLFMSLFKSRVDVYAKRWQSKEGKSGYTPVCLNEWKPGLCRKPRVRCADCASKAYGVLNERVIEEHLRGNIVIGVYPMYPDESCCFLAIDFDDEGWQQDIAALRDCCKDFDITVAIERSRSGNGAHAWFFFDKPISAALARKLGTALLTYSMNKRHELTFKSYDRLFPNQDTMPKGGFGNLIALPLQMSARRSDNSVFIDENFASYPDQWGFLSDVKKLSEESTASLIRKLCPGNELGSLKEDDEDEEKPWEQKQTKIKLSTIDFPTSATIIKSNMLFIAKPGFSQRALNRLKRLSAFRNPEFYKAQAMRMPTFNKPRIISCSDETEKYLCLPRGCEADLTDLLTEYNVHANWQDERNCGRPIDVEFKGQLREEQDNAASEMLKHETGVLSATTAFGKTVLAAALIAERKVNTLVLVHRQQLLLQWNSRLTEFLAINEKLPVIEKKRGRKMSQSVIGQIGAGKDRLSDIVDIAVMQSLVSKGEVKDCVRNYGMVIVDECHHISAVSFEQILKGINAKYVYGLTATPVRKDGHHPVIFMQCGPIRYRDDAKKQADKRPFNHYLIPRFTGFRPPSGKDEKELSIQDIYADIVSDEARNQLIVDDVVRGYERGRNSLVLTERTAHVDLLAKRLSERVPDVITLVGGMSSKDTKEALIKISQTPPGKKLTIVATGKYIGEGFDEARLDTLFLAMPISWKGTLQQYAGRLHRLCESKTEVQIYDYVDTYVRMLDRMYNKRLNGYAAIGYKAKGEGLDVAETDKIFDQGSFWPVYSSDIANAAREIFIVSPFVTKRRGSQIVKHLAVAASKHVKVTILTRPVEDFKPKDASTLQDAFELLKDAGVNVIFKSNIHQKFAVVDQRIVWYGSINLLSYGSAEESMMRIENFNIASELLRSILF